MKKSKKATSLLDFVRIDRHYVICHFKCKVKNKTVVSTVPFEPYDGKIEITFKEILLHPIKTYNRYYHTPITIYGENTHETIILKAFEKVSKYFIWNDQKQQYIYNYKRQ